MTELPETLIVRKIWGSRDFKGIGDYITTAHELGAKVALVGPEADFESWQAVLPSDSLSPITLPSGKYGRIGPWTDELEAIQHQFETGGMIYAHREKRKTHRHNTLAGHLASRIAQSARFAGRTSLSFLFETDGLGVSFPDRSIISGARIALEGGASADCVDRYNPDIATTFALQRMHYSNGSFHNAVCILGS